MINNEKIKEESLNERILRKLGENKVTLEHTKRYLAVDIEKIIQTTIQECEKERNLAVDIMKNLEIQLAGCRLGRKHDKQKVIKEIFADIEKFEHDEIGINLDIKDTKKRWKELKKKWLNEN